MSRAIWFILLASCFVSQNFLLGLDCISIKDISGGEVHTLARMSDNTLWSCGTNVSGREYYVLGLGKAVPHVYSLQPVLGEDGEEYLQNIEFLDAGWYHSLAANESRKACPNIAQNRSIRQKNPF